MSADPFHLNRPVHLARRDVYYLKAVERIQKLLAQKLPAERGKTAEQALYLLREARLHAEAANRSDKTSTQNRLFTKFLDIAVDNTLSVARMLRRQTEAKACDNAFDGFIGSSGTGANMSGRYRQCEGLILKGLLRVLQQAAVPFADLSRTSLAKMTLEDKARYEKAKEHFEALADEEADRVAEFPD